MCGMDAGAVFVPGVPGFPPGAFWQRVARDRGRAVRHRGFNHTSPAATAGSTKILPSPMRPVRAAATIRSTTSSTRASSTQS